MTERKPAEPWVAAQIKRFLESEPPITPRKYYSRMTQAEKDMGILGIPVVYDKE